MPSSGGWSPTKTTPPAKTDSRRDSATKAAAPAQLRRPAALFGASAGMTSAIISEGVGYVVLLIPKRIKKLKAEGRKEGRMEERKKARKRAGEARERAGEAVDRFKKGEISIAELRRLLTGQDDAPDQD